MARSPPFSHVLGARQLYYGSCKSFRAALDKEVLCKSFAEMPLWTAPPMVPGGVFGGLTQRELGKVSASGARAF